MNYFLLLLGAVFNAVTVFLIVGNIPFGLLLSVDSPFYFNVFGFDSDILFIALLVPLVQPLILYILKVTSRKQFLHITAWSYVFELLLLILMSLGTH